MTDDLDPKLAKALRGECAYSGCHDPAVDGEHCAPHAAHEAARKRRADKRQRQARADSGRCIVAGCGKKVGKRRRPDGTIMQRRCPGCGKALRDAARSRRSADGAKRSADGTPSETVAGRGVLMLEPGKRDGLVVRRYTTDRGRGAPSKEDRRRDALKLIDDAIAALPRYRARLQAWLRDEVQALPRIQRQALLDELLEDAIHAPTRMIEGGAEELSELG